MESAVAAVKALMHPAMEPAPIVRTERQEPMEEMEEQVVVDMPMEAPLPAETEAAEAAAVIPT